MFAMYPRPQRLMCANPLSKLTLRAIVALAVLACAVLPPVRAQCNECRGDYNNNGEIDLSDLAALNAVFGDPVTPSDPEWCLNFNWTSANNNSTIDLPDLAMMLTAFGSPCELADQPAAGGGAPRAWETGQIVSKFSTYNLASGNLFTAIPIDSCDPVGPPIGFALYHNSAHAHNEISGATGMGFDLGPGWSSSYSARIIGDPNTPIVTVIEDDGTENDFGLLSGDYVPPTGVFDKLDRTTDPEPPGTDMVWTLTRTSQEKFIFNDDGYLIRHVDSAGNVVRIARDSGNDYRITHISSAAEGLTGVSQHRITLAYDSDKLDTVTDVMGRVWTLDYNGDGYLESIHFPDGPPPWDPNIPAIDPSSIEIAYDTSDPNSLGRISEIVDRDLMKWVYGYDYTPTVANPHPARFETVEEWGNDPGATAALLTKSFSPTLHEITSNTYRRSIVDNRGETWKVYFTPVIGATAKAVHFEDPLGNDIYRTYDADLNVATETDALFHTWTYTYGPVGNVTSVTSPLPSPDPNNPTPQTWTYDWEAVGGTGTNFYRLIEVTDPVGHWTTYDYADPTDPTLVTTITEIADGSGSAWDVESETTIAYYDPNTPHARGQVRVVTDANGVEHETQYDKWGYVSKRSEGIVTPGFGPTYPYVHKSSSDDAGRPISGSDDPNDPNGACYPYLIYDANGNVSGSFCCLFFVPPAESFRLGVHPAPTCGERYHSLKSAEYDIVRRPVTIERDNWDIIQPPNSASFELQRRYSYSYDDLGRSTGITTSSHVGTTQTLSRATTISYAKTGGTETAGPTAITGPDGAVATTTYDELGRVSTITRGGMELDPNYDAAGRVTQIEYGNGMKTLYEYDEADRTIEVQHQNAGSTVLQKYEYVWNHDNTMASRTETDNVAGTVTVVDFEYDARKRLTREHRVTDSVDVYDLAYVYDQLGNRMSKDDTVTGRSTEYFYDADAGNRDPDFQTNNNRLLWYNEYVLDPNDNPVHVRTVKYLYYLDGNVSNITVKDHYIDSTLSPGSSGDYDWHYDVAFCYYRNKHVRRVMTNRFKVDGSGDATDFEPLTAREFRFDGGRQRYATIDYDCEGTTSEDLWTRVGDVHWTDYIGDTPYGDFDIAENGSAGVTQIPQRRYFGLGGDETLDPNGDVTDSRYWHGDLIDSTGLVTRPSGSGGTGNVDPSTTAYTAFGEQVGGAGYQPANVDMRYRYAGGHGYEADGIVLEGLNPNLASIRLSHVGERWYDPGIGRFVQRDPIGLRGGANLYGYGAQDPVTKFDSNGTEVITVVVIAGGAIVVGGLVYWACDLFWSADAASKKAAVQRKIASQRGYADYDLSNTHCVSALLNTPGMSNNWRPGVPTNPYSGTKAIVNGGIGCVGGP